MIFAIVHAAVLISAFLGFWFIAFLCLLPFGMGAGVEPQTGAPLEPRLKQKALWATAAAVALWLIFYAVLAQGWVDL